MNGFSVTFLIDNGANECFVGTTFAEKNGLEMTKTKEKFKIHLGDGIVRVSNRIVKQGCVMMGEHAEYLEFAVINLPTYDAILGKPWLDRWNPAINWKTNTMQWKVGTILITMTRVQDPKTQQLYPVFLNNALQSNKYQHNA